jgi:hypothetical protein
MNKNIKYLADGREIEVIKKIEDGYLVKQTWQFHGEGDEEDDDKEFTGEIEFFPKVYNKPPTEKLAAEVIALNKEIHSLHEQLSGLKHLKETEKSLLNSISKIPGLESIVNYLKGDFKYLLYLDNLTIKSYDEVYHKQEFQIIMDRSGKLIFKTDSYDGKAIITFQNKEDADAERRRLFIERISTAPNYRWLESYAKEYYNRDLMIDPIIKAMWDTKMTEVREFEKKENISRAMKEINDKLIVLKSNGINYRIVHEEIETNTGENT